MHLGDLFKKANKNFFDFNSQNDYISRLFKKAGITKDYDENYLRHLYLGTSKLSENCKARFPDKMDEAVIASFFEKHVKEEKKLYESFGLIDMEVDSSCFFIVLARQFIEIVKAPENTEAEDIVASEYVRLTTAPDQKKASPPLYRNDSVLCTGENAVELNDVYATYRHTWRIRNVGSVEWKERKLVFSNAKDSRIKAKENEIMIPDLKPRGRTEVSMEFQCRGFEGHFLCHWEMQDKCGDDCFPGSSYFDVVLNIRFCV